ncbi:MAG: substrate-binding domain-containing protein, partial [Dehalococcoidia bacterium]|nr:substrate-binding domain-containing protein [Dehalococcoidia bacterium]
MQAIQQPVEIRLDLQGDVPLYLQITEQVQACVASERLQPGQQLPTVRGLASQLGINPGTVAKAYGELERDGVIVTHRGGGSYVAAPADTGRLSAMREGRLWGIIGKASLEALSLGYAPEEIEAAFVLRMARWRQEREKGASGAVFPDTAAGQNTIVLTGSHDLTLDLLASHLRLQHQEIKLSITSVGSLGGLIALQREEAHLAGSHLLDDETGEYNIPFIKRLLPGQEAALVVLAHRYQGLMVAKGNPKGINGLDDLRRHGVRFINRQRGSGTRVLLDYKMRQLGITPEEIEGYDHEVDTHVAVAAAVAGGAADVGLGIYSAARSLGLGFVGLLKERYDLVIPRRHYESQLLKPLFDIIIGNEFKRVVNALGGYDTAETG